MLIINEKTSLTLILSFRNNEGELVQPTSVNYVLKVKDTSDEILQGTLTDLEANEVSEGVVYELQLSKSDNTIFNDTESDETHILVVDWSYNDGTDGSTKEYKFIIRNLSNIQGDD